MVMLPSSIPANFGSSKIFSTSSISVVSTEMQRLNQLSVVVSSPAKRWWSTSSVFRSSEVIRAPYSSRACANTRLPEPCVSAAGSSATEGSVGLLYFGKGHKLWSSNSSRTARSVSPIVPCSLANDDCEFSGAASQSAFGVLRMVSAAATLSCRSALFASYWRSEPTFWGLASAPAFASPSSSKSLPDERRMMLRKSSPPSWTTFSHVGVGPWLSRFTSARTTSTSMVAPRSSILCAVS
mmetsp:Transcript_61852/g.170263  ORF Transcript_61852/g.170263 Transcript_61852/m.170263 type:complete len:239 (+) Transcript_61852:4019-4735(+)